jgi:hypothetical protein
LLLSLQLLLQHGDLLLESILNAGNIVSVACSHDHIGGELFKLLLELVEPGSLGQLLEAPAPSVQGAVLALELEQALEGCGVGANRHLQRI